MSRIDRLVGLVRSLAIYHAIPLRQRRLRRLDAQFVEPGDLVFSSPAIEIVEAAAADAPGSGSLSVSERTPTVTTLASAWREARAGDPDFAGVQWNRRIEVETTTLDLLMARFGVPSFIKIDVEGGEPTVLAGLAHAVPALSFEYLPRAIDQVQAYCARLTSLG